MKRIVALLGILVLLLTSSISVASAEITFPNGVKFYDTVEELKSKVSVTGSGNTYKTQKGTLAGFPNSYIEYGFENRNGKQVLVQARYHFNNDDFGNSSKMGDAWIDLVNSIAGKYAEYYSVGYYKGLKGGVANYPLMKENYRFILKAAAAEAADSGVTFGYFELEDAYSGPGYHVKIELYEYSHIVGFTNNYTVDLCYYAYTNEQLNQVRNKKNNMGDDL